MTTLDIAKHIPADDPDGWSPERVKWEQDWAEAVHGTTAVELKYSPDQPRDEAGRFSSDGGEPVEFRSDVLALINGGAIHPEMSARFSEWGASTTATERTAIRNWADNGWERMNKALRRGASVPSKMALQLDELDSALEKASTDTDYVSWRAMGPAVTRLHAGEEFVDRGFVSTSMNVAAVGEFRTGIDEPLIRVTIPKGSHAAYLPVIDGVHPREAEMLIARDAKFEVGPVREVPYDSVGMTLPESMRETMPHLFEPVKVIDLRLVSTGSKTVKEWDEDLHPRDEAGRFTESDGGEAPPTRPLGFVAFNYTGEVVPGNTQIIWHNDVPKAVVDHVKAGLKFLRSKGENRIHNVVIDANEFEPGSRVIAVTYAYGFGEGGLQGEVRINPDAYARDMERTGDGDGWFSTDDPNSTMIHENGHIVNRGNTAGEPALTDEERAVAATVSQYATTNKSEFLAEAYTAKTLGKGLTPEAQNLYDSLQKTKEWDEEAHPRDDQGRFTDSGGDGELSQSQKSAVNHYTALGHYMMNNMLRGTAESIPNDIQNEYQSKIKLVRSAIDSSPIPKAMTVYRGGRVPDGVKPGTVFQDKGFVSTSTKESTAYGYISPTTEKMIQIHLPAGSHALSVESATNMEGGEHEWILPPGSSFKVTAVEGDTIKADLIP